MIAKQEIQTFRDTRRVLLRGDDFIYLLPHPALRGQISNYTVTFPNKSIISDGYTIIPHGSATLVFSWDGRGGGGNLFGPMTRPCAVGALANQYEMLLIVEFQPGGLSAFTGGNQWELADRTIAFDAVRPGLDRLIWQALEGIGRLEALVQRLDGILLEQLHVCTPPALRLATALVIEHAGNLSGKDLSDAVYYSQRHLNRILEQYLGMGVKTFSRLVRINKAIRLMRSTGHNLTRASDEAGFYDLPHFIHDFKAVCGMTPREYRNNMSDFYSEIAKF